MSRRREVVAVLDASALLAYLKGERGRSAVRAVIGGAMVSAVNLCEVLSRSAAPETDLDDLRSLGLQVAPFATDDSVEAAGLFSSTRGAGLSLGDRACLALGRKLGVPVLTSDAAWLKVETGAKVRLIR